jgi:hemolysin activation/secretion protein
MQISADPLFSLEKFAVGGANSVRGYRENELVRDTGLTTSLEFRIPIFKDESGQTPFQIAPFIDYGYSRNKGGGDPAPNDLLGAGVGLRWDPDPSFHAEVYLAKGFTNVDDDNRSYDLQDKSIHFQMSYQLY